jgi:hypothetical protein
MHGMTENTWNALSFQFTITDTLALGKSPRGDPTKTNYLHLNKQQIRAIADEIHAVYSFGLNIYLYVSARKTGGVLTDESGRTSTPTLPEKPPLPNNLNLSDSPIPQGEVLRP